MIPMDPIFTVPDAQFLWHVVSRLGAAALLGGLIGIEREWTGKAAGLRNQHEGGAAGRHRQLGAHSRSRAAANPPRVHQRPPPPARGTGAGSTRRRVSAAAVAGPA